MMTATRFRYALFPGDTYQYFIDTPASRKEMIANGAEAFSVHTFDQPLEHNPRPNRVWGDLHLSFDTIQSSSSERMPDIVNFLFTKDIPDQSVKAYYVDNCVEIIIAENSFRGEIGSPCRLNFDRDIRLLLGTDSIRQIQINSVPIPMSQTLVLELVAPKRLEGSAYPLPMNNDYFKGSRITPLTRRYFLYHATFKGQKDYLPTQLAFVTKCSIFNTLLLHGGTPTETAIVCDLFGGHILFFEHLLHLHGRTDLIFENLPQELEKYRANKRYRTGCTSIDSALSHYPEKYKCNQGCGVSSPVALAYLPSPPRQKPIIYEDEHFILNATGLYFVDPERNRKTRVMNPIWVKNTLQASEDAMGAREIVCYDVNGFVTNLVIKEDLIDSSKLFPLLRSKGIHVPKDTILCGKLRQYLASHFPPKRPKTPTAYVSSIGGWQRDNSFIFPDSTVSTSSTYTLNSQVLPVGVKSKKLLPHTSSHTTTSDPYLLLSTLASLSAPFLKHRKLPGLNRHFHGGTEASRAAIVHAASSVWDQTPYLFADAEKHLVALKMQHKDAVLGILEIPPTKTKTMNSLVRRYFYGRKGGDKGIRGVIISSGETPMGQGQNSEKGFNAFTHQNNVLGIDIWIGNSSPTGFHFNYDATRTIVQQLEVHGAKYLERIQTCEKRFKKQLKWTNRTQPYKQISDFLRFFMAVGYIDQVGLKSWWQGGALLPIFDQLLSGIDTRDALFCSLLKHMNLSMPLPDKLVEWGACSPTSYIEIDRDSILIPSKEMREIAKDKPTLLRFISWLKARKILIPKRTGDLCGAHYSPKDKKTLRGYKISRHYFYKTLANLTA
ncbi:MAG: DUF927 domain-containing protein [Desulfovibrionaceae bacterium]